MESKSQLSLLSEVPTADILIIRRTGNEWTLAQRRWLADGLRHTNASQILIEFKYSEEFSLTALQQLNAYDYF